MSQETAEKEASEKAARIQQQQTNTRLFVGSFAPTLTDAILRSESEKYGAITECVIIKDKKGVSKGFGFVEYKSAEDSQKAIFGFANNDFVGRVSYARPQVVRKVGGGTEARVAARQAPPNMEERKRRLTEELLQFAVDGLLPHPKQVNKGEKKRKKE